MTISAPTFQIHCDEPGCQNFTTLLMTPEPTGYFRGSYEITDVEARYAHWGGETLADGKHRCSECRARLAEPSPDLPAAA
jgi:hypothetical protein